MTGNVWEWVADYYDSNYYKNSPSENPTGPSDGTARVVRGGSWYSYNTDYLRAASRGYDDPDFRVNDFGFRCVSAPEDSEK